MIIHITTMPAEPAVDTREAILAAALDLFAERGFFGTSMPALAERAALGTGTPYRHFESKEELVNAVYRRCKQGLTATLFGDFPFDDSARGQFRAFWWRLSGFFRAHPRAFEFLELHHHQPYLDRESQELERQSLSPILAFLDAARHAGVVRAMPAAALGAIVWGIFAGLMKAERLGHLRLSDELWAQAEVSAWDAIRRQDDAPSRKEETR